MFRSGLALLLTFSVVLQPASLLPLAARPGKRQTVTEIKGDEAVLHALNRLTFGPRPGDMDRVKAMGLKAWIDQQLHPERIPDPRLEAALGNLPALELGEQQLIERYPPEPLIRAARGERILIPGDPVAHAIYTDQIAYLDEKKEAKAANGANPPNPPNPAGQANQASPAGQADQANLANQANLPNQANMANPASTGNPNASPAGPAASPAPAPASQQQAEEHLYADLRFASVLGLPPEQRVQKLIAFSPDDLRSFMRMLAPEQRLELTEGMTAEQKEVVIALQNPTALVAAELLQARLLRDVLSERQLQAVMTDFWLNHFNVHLRKGPYMPWYLADYQDRVILPRAMGRFEDLLVATAQSPAMLFYLDNWQSTGAHSMAAVRGQQMASRFPNSPMAANARERGINENYARELMELHTLGVDGGYTQKDVIELAKILSGWTIDRPGRGGYQFHFDERLHEPGSKVFLGHTIHEGGEKEGLEALHILAASPTTARFLSRKLAVRFVSDDPPPALIDRMADAYLKHDGNISDVLGAMLDSRQFWSRDAYRAKVKTPEEFVLSAVRATGGDVEHPIMPVEALDRLGMSLYGMLTPNGYPWTAEAWVNSTDLVARMNFSLALASNRAGVNVDLRRWLPPGADADRKVKVLAQALLNGQASEQTLATIRQQMDQPSLVPAAAVNAGNRPPQQPKAQAGIPGGGRPIFPFLLPPLPPPPDQQAATAAGLLLGSPDFQRR